MWGDKKYRDFEDALSSKGTQRNSLSQIDFMDPIASKPRPLSALKLRVLYVSFTINSG